MDYKKLFLIVLTVLFYNSLDAQWTVRKDGNGTATVTTNTAFIASSDGRGGEITGIGFTSLGSQSVTFNYSFTTVDPGYDYFFYTIDGIETIIASYNQGGLINISLSNGQVFFMGINNADGVEGPGQVTITNLIPPQSAFSLNLSNPLGTLTSICAGIPSTPATFNVTGSNLSSTVTVSAPSGFEISTVSNTSYASSLTLTPDGLNTVSSTLYIRLTSTATNNISGTITALSTSGGTTTSATTTVTSTIASAPTFTGGTTYNLCKEATYLISLTVANTYNGWSTSSNTITVNNGYVTAGTSTGPYTVSYTDACAQTVSATVTVNNSENGVTPISDGHASYKISNSAPIPQGPTANIYVGYNGFNYFSATMPTNTGYYKANNQSGSSAGCPYPFYIFRCTTCPD